MVKFLKYLLVEVMNKYGSFMWFGTHVSMMCQDERVFKAMEMAGTPCPYMGKIGKEANEQWAANKEERPDFRKRWWEVWKKDTTEDLPVAKPAGE